MKYKSKAVVMVFLALCSWALSSSRASAQNCASVNIHEPADQAATKPFRDALYRHRPVLKFDSGEKFFPVRAEAATNHNGNRLTRENRDLIKERRDDRGLSIRYLRHGDSNYPTPDENGDSDVRGSDDINLLGLKPGDFVGDDRKLENTIYTRICYQREGTRITGAWLQYWFLYYYNDYPGTDSGDHEGDWEMVQILVNAQARPLVAVYASHEGGIVGDWNTEGAIEKTGPGRVRPIVYVALGSHASYFHAKPCKTDVNFGDWELEKYKFIRYIRFGSKSTRTWLSWPGQWGGNAKSPHGPRFQSGSKWDNPTQFFKDSILGDCGDVF
jgi:hypothetical protein